LLVSNTEKLRIQGLSFDESRIASIEDLRLLAQRRLPKVIFDYVDGGADGEVTMRANQSAFQSIEFRPRTVMGVPNCDLRTSVLSHTLSFPLILAPVGHSCVIYPRGELAAVRAAGAANTVYVLPTLSGETIEDISKCTTGPVWYQLYLWGGREAAEAAIERANNAGISALVVTIDSIVGGNRERDIRNGAGQLLMGDLVSKIPYLRQFIVRPRWLGNYLRNGGMPKWPNVVVPRSTSRTLSEIRYQGLEWRDVGWIREAWKRPLIIKGILTADDARRAIDAGADALIVSNHGGRQLDCLPSSLKALSEVVDAVGAKSQILMDGGIRRGSDIAKAVCLGARAVLCGRAFAYGLAVGGEAGVAFVLSTLRNELERTLRFLGCESVDALDSSYIRTDLINPGG
jgi:isopentenyl diphosphate isomerase/L-lactate dehydrogenase-like FMN-dependent dehydrogenase